MFGAEVCKIMMVAGVALLLFGFASFAHDIANSSYYVSTTIGDVIDAINIFHYYSQRSDSVTEVFRTIMLWPFAYACFATGVVALIVGAICSRGERSIKI